MTSRGSLGSQLQRAVKAGNLGAAEMLAIEMDRVPLDLAFELTLLILGRQPERYPAAARRLIERLAGERAIDLGGLAATATALAELELEPGAADLKADLQYVARYGSYPS